MRFSIRSFAVACCLCGAIMAAIAEHFGKSNSLIDVTAGAAGVGFVVVGITILVAHRGHG